MWCLYFTSEFLFYSMLQNWLESRVSGLYKSRKLSVNHGCSWWRLAEAELGLHFKCNKAHAQRDDVQVLTLESPKQQSCQEWGENRDSKRRWLWSTTVRQTLLIVPQLFQARVLAPCSLTGNYFCHIFVKYWDSICQVNGIKFQRSYLKAFMQWKPPFWSLFLLKHFASCQILGFFSVFFNRIGMNWRCISDLIYLKIKKQRQLHMVFVLVRIW